MTGILCVVAGASAGLTATMTVGSGAFAVAKSTFYVDGFIGAGSFADALAPTIGALAPSIFKGAAVKSLYWQSPANGGHGSAAGTQYIEIEGNRAADFISKVSINGVSMGAIGAPSYNGTYNTTQYVLGTAGTYSNPFGTSGTKTITIT